MRLRYVKGAPEAVAKSPYCVKNPSSLRGGWKDFWQSSRPIHLEIGMGKGQFLLQTAAMHPDISYIGLERFESVLYRAVQRMEEDPMENVLFLCADAYDLASYFAPGEIDKLYLNFSDPWPKERHAKRRLTSRRFLDIYSQILSDGAELEFKTDNADLFAFSLEELAAAPNWEVIAETEDLYHNEAMLSGNIKTEYEQRFLRQGKKICKLTAAYAK